MLYNAPIVTHFWRSTVFFSVKTQLCGNYSIFDTSQESKINMWLFNNVLSSQSLNNEHITTKVFSTVITRISILIYLLWRSCKYNLFFVQTMDWMYVDVSWIQDRMCGNFKETKGTNIFRHVSTNREKRKELFSGTLQNRL